ncbi:hypothetical protein RAD16_12245 [Bradyrhizobium sp. 18BD]
MIGKTYLAATLAAFVCAPALADDLTPKIAAHLVPPNAEIQISWTSSASDPQGRPIEVACGEVTVRNPRGFDTVTFAYVIGEPEPQAIRAVMRYCRPLMRLARTGRDSRPFPDFRSSNYFPEPAPPPAWLPMLLVLLPPAEGGCVPLLSAASFCMFDERPVVIPLVAGPRDEGPTSPWPEAPGAGCDCAKAPPVVNARMQADAKMIFFIRISLGLSLDNL